SGGRRPRGVPRRVSPGERDGRRRRPERDVYRLSADPAGEPRAILRDRSRPPRDDRPGGDGRLGRGGGGQLHQDGRLRRCPDGTAGTRRGARGETAPPGRWPLALQRPPLAPAPGDVPPVVTSCSVPRHASWSAGAGSRNGMAGGSEMRRRRRWATTSRTAAQSPRLQGRRQRPLRLRPRTPSWRHTSRAPASLAAARAASLAAIPDGQGKDDGIAVGEAAAAVMVASRSSDGSSPPQFYKRRTTRGNDDVRLRYQSAELTDPSAASRGNRGGCFAHTADRLAAS